MPARQDHKGTRPDFGNLLVAVDVGTTSARAGVVTREGAVLARTERPIAIQRTGADRAEHKSGDIWQAVCGAVRAAVESADADPAAVAAISFAATCSLVVRDEKGAPLCVAPDGKGGWDTIAWLDHRALSEAAEVTAGGHEVLDHCGGVMSPEMEIPKLMWLKRNLPDVWRRAGHMFDLTDFLTWRASGSLARSQSTLTSKWMFLAHRADGWQGEFLKSVGLGDLIARANLPRSASPIGTGVGTLTEKAARELGLHQSCLVATGLVDAHAGALGILGQFAREPETIHRHLGLIAGTSSAVVALAPDARPARGIWGPYYGAVLPGMWLSEGGQSASGAALDHIIRLHAADPSPQMHAKIIERITQMRAGQEGDIAPRLHVLPDFHGNRSPYASPGALGVISGLSLDSSFDGLCKLYWRTAVSVALGVRQILETLNATGYAIDTLHISGGHTRNPLLMELYADVSGCTVHALCDADAMILGTAMSAATAAGLYPDLVTAAEAMHHAAEARQPDPAKHDRYDRDYRVFQRMHEHRREIEKMA